MDNNVSEQTFNVADIHPAGSDVYRIILKPRSGFVPSYRAGQYLEILLADQLPCAFSIASAPTDQQETLELHIQQFPDSTTSTLLFNQMEKGCVEVRMPSGNCFLPDPLPETPLVFIAAGTGFAQVKSMVEYCLNQNHSRGIHLYWGARTPAGFYLPHLPLQWSARGIHYHPVVSDVMTDNGWCGRQGLLYDAILADKEQLRTGTLYLSGSPQMVYTTVDVIENAGFTRQSMHSDVFEYSPR